MGSVNADIKPMQNMPNSELNASTSPPDHHMGSSEGRNIESNRASQELPLQQKRNDLISGVFVSTVSLTAKFQRAVKKASRIGKGLAEMEKLGGKGIILQESFWKEQNCKLAEKSKGGCETSIYLDSEERKRYITTFEKMDGENNVFLMRRGKKFRSNNTEITKAIYVLDSKKMLYTHKISIPKPFETEIQRNYDLNSAGFCHSSFLAGGAVAGAGTISTNARGEIIEITNLSGHYLPSSQDMLFTLRIFVEKGVDLSKVKLTIMDQTRNIYSCNAREFLDSNGFVRLVSPPSLPITDWIGEEPTKPH